MTGRRNRRRRRRDEAGYALLTATVFSFLLVLGGMAAFKVAANEHRATHYDWQEWQAYALAEAAVERGRARLMGNAEWRDGFSDVQMTEGDYSLTVVDTTMAGVQNAVKLVGTGNCGEAVRSLEVLGGLSDVAEMHSLIIGDYLNILLGKLCVRGLVSVGRGTGDLNSGCDHTLSDEAIPPPAMYTEGAYYPNSTYYEVRAFQHSGTWYAHIYDRDGVDITTAKGDSLYGIVSRSGNYIRYNFNSTSEIDRYFHEDTGVFCRVSGDQGIVVNFGSAAETSPGNSSYTRLTLSPGSNRTIHQTLICARFTGSFASQRLNPSYWRGDYFSGNRVTIAPYNGVALIARRVNQFLSTLDLGTSGWPAITFIADDYTSVISDTDFVGLPVVLDDWWELFPSDVTNNSGYVTNLPPYLQTYAGSDTEGAFRIVSWKGIR